MVVLLLLGRLPRLLGGTIAVKILIITLSSVLRLRLRLRLSRLLVLLRLLVGR